MALRLRGRTQILDSSLALGKFKGVNSGSIIGNSGSGPAALSSSDARTVLGLSTSDSVAFGSIGSTNITVGDSKTLNLSGGTLTLADDQISGDKVNGGDISGDLTLSGSQITVDNALSAGSLASSSVNIDGGNIDGTAIGNDSASSGSFTSLIASGGGSSAIDNLPIGSNTASSGAFTSLSASTSLAVSSTLTVNSDGDLTTSGTISSTEASGSNSITGNLTIGGNLTINGDKSVNNVSNLSVEDSLLSLASGNDSSDSLDIGFHALTSDSDPSLDATDYPSISSPKTRSDFSSLTDGNGDPITDASGYYAVNFGMKTSISGNGLVMVSYLYVLQEGYFELYFYDWNSSTESWDERSDTLSYNRLNAGSGTHDRIVDFQLNYDGNKICVAVQRYVNYYHTQIYFLEYQDTNSDGNRDSWVNYLTKNNRMSGATNTTQAIAWHEKSNGDIVLVESMPYFQGGNTGRVTTSTFDASNNYAVDWSVYPTDLNGSNANEYMGLYGLSLNDDATVLAVAVANKDKARIYSWDSTNYEWDLQDTIEHPDPVTQNTTDLFSADLHLNGDGTKLALGAMMREGIGTYDNNSFYGRVYFYKYNSTSGEWESDSDYPSVTGELNSDGYKLSISDDFNTLVVGNPAQDHYFISSDEYDDHPDNINGFVRTYSYDSSNSSWSELYDSQYSKNIYAGLFRDATNGKFRLFKDSEQNDWSTNVVDITATGYSVATLVANLEGDVTGNLTGNADSATAFATARDFSITGDFTASAVSFDGSSNVVLDASIDNGVVVVSDLSTDMVITSSETFTDSDVLIPTTSAAKAYILSQISSSSDPSAENGNFKIADSSGDFSKSERVFQKSTISSSDVSNGYVSISTDIDTNFEFLAEVYLNGQKIRSGTSTQVGNSEREYYFDTSSSGSHKIYLNSSIMKSDDKLEIIYFILS